MYKHMEIYINKNYKSRTGGHKASIRKHHAWFLGDQSGDKGRMGYTATIYTYIYIYTFVSLWCGPLAKEGMSPPIPPMRCPRGARQARARRQARQARQARQGCSQPAACRAGHGFPSGSRTWQTKIE